jgi:hypothetical protein
VAIGVAPQAGFLVQTTRIPAVLLHCHSALNPETINGLGRLNPTERKTATQVSVTIAAMRAIFLGDHNVWFIAFTPVQAPAGYKATAGRHVRQITFWPN